MDDFGKLEDIAILGLIVVIGYFVYKMFSATAATVTSPNISCGYYSSLDALPFGMGATFLSDDTISNADTQITVGTLRAAGWDNQTLMDYVAASACGTAAQVAQSVSTPTGATTPSLLGSLAVGS
jgi:hypothetical protein